MGRFVYTDIADKAERHLAMTSLTADEFADLLPHFETAFQAHMADWCLDGSPHTGRRYATYTNCPLPSPQERLLFILIYVKTYPLQETHGAMFDLPQGKTNMWIHTLLPMLQRAFQQLGDAPSRNLHDLAQRVQAEAPAVEPASTPLFVMMAPNDVLTIPQDTADQQGYYSGKKQCHAIKNILLIDAVLRIVFLSDTYEGSVHDKRIADSTRYPLPDGSELLQDRGRNCSRLG